MIIVFHNTYDQGGVLEDDNGTTKYNMLKMKILKMTDDSRLEKKRRKQMARYVT